MGLLIFWLQTCAAARVEPGVDEEEEEEEEEEGATKDWTLLIPWLGGGVAWGPVRGGGGGGGG